MAFEQKTGGQNASSPVEQKTGGQNANSPVEQKTGGQNASSPVEQKTGGQNASSPVDTQALGQPSVYSQVFPQQDYRSIVEPIQARPFHQSPIIIFEYRDVPVHTVCPYCHAEVVTSVRYVTGTFSWLIFFFLCMFGCCLISFIPLILDNFRDVIHTCPNCNRMISHWRRL